MKKITEWAINHPKIALALWFTLIILLSVPLLFGNISVLSRIGFVIAWCWCFSYMAFSYIREHAAKTPRTPQDVNLRTILKNEKTEPCPFCGGNASIVRETHIPIERIVSRFEMVTKAAPRANDGWLMECETCGARGPHEYTKPIQSRAEAVTKWNRRFTG